MLCTFYASTRFGSKLAEPVCCYVDSLDNYKTASCHRQELRMRKASELGTSISCCVSPIVLYAEITVINWWRSSVELKPHLHDTIRCTRLHELSRLLIHAIQHPTLHCRCCWVFVQLVVQTAGQLVMSCKRGLRRSTCHDDVPWRNFSSPHLETKFQKHLF